MNPCIAIIDRNTLNRSSIRNILCSHYSRVEVLTYDSINSFILDSNRHFIHFFVSSDILFSHFDEFELLMNRTTVISVGTDRKFSRAGFNVLDISLPEEELVARLLQIELASRFDSFSPESTKDRKAIDGSLSGREKEILALIVKGYTNKEMANELAISITTVIFHRNNICEKLNTRSVGRMTVFAVLSGIVEINEI